MATMPASIRGTPSFTPAPTQNTAPVHEFRCLFTHDAHKKAKKWHDGSVRFHTFNRRVMLYDEGKNYVGDLHYRQDEEFEEGIELRLDRGILVDVGERLGETQTDLAPLLDRKKDETSPQSARNIRLAAAVSQKGPRPLSQIIPIQRRIGRARLMPSPYQQRQALAPVQPTEPSMPPPPKRQKVDVSAKENRPVSPKPIEKPTPEPVQRVELKRRAPRHAPLKEPILDFQDVVDLSSDEEIAKSARKQIPKPKNRNTQSEPWANKRSTTIEEVDSTIRLRDTMSRKQAEPKTTHPQMFATVAKQSAPKSQSHPEESSSRSNISQPSTSSQCGITQLLFRSQKPRCKLIYRALLPSSKADTCSVDLSLQEDLERPSNVIECRGVKSNDVPRLDGASPEKRPASRRGSADDPIGLPSSPLFIPEDKLRKSPTRSLKCSQDGLEEQMLQDPDIPNEKAPSPANDSPSPELSPVASIPEQDVSRSPHLPNPFPSNQKRMLPPLHEPSMLQNAVAPSPRQRSFRRVQSENDAFQETDEDALDLDGFSAPPPSFLAKAQASPARVFRGPSKSPAKLRRTASDSAVMEENNERMTSYNIQPGQEDVGETGPWTSTEAFLLFDWWPPGKARPDYGVLAATEVNTAQCAPPKATITTARDILRNEINVL